MKILHLLPAIALVGLVAGSVAVANGIALEYKTDRPGSDYRDFDLPRGAQPEACQEACEFDDQCRAFTYVRAGVQSDFPRCWLKSSAPPANANDCCVSGVRPGEADTNGAEPDQDRNREPGSAEESDRISFEYNVNRQGSDYRDFDLSRGDGPEMCRQACEDEDQCRAFTYVKAGVQADNPRCWLKNSVPQAYPDDNCVSGVKD
jgi:hypothetical protein